MTEPDFIGAAWRKSRACSDGMSCVKVARADDQVGVRDSGDGGEGPILVFGEQGWRAFVAGVRAGDFDE